MKNLLTAAILLCSVYYVNAQFYTSYSWSDNPQSYIDENFADKESVFVLKKQHVEHFEDAKQGVVEYNLTHHIYFLNSDDAIESFNKVYIPIAPQRELMLTKARVVTPTGEVKELGEDKIIQAEDQESGRTLKYFAFEGVEKGSYIEYMHVLKMGPQVYGTRINMQQFIPVKEAVFELKTLNKLEFKFKSYNGLGEVQTRDEENTIVYSITAQDIPEMPRESMATPRTHLQYFIYALDNNNFNNSKDISSYSGVAKNIHNYLYQEFNKKQEKSLAKLAKSINFEKLTTTDEKVKAIENYIKRNFYVTMGPNEQLSNFDFMVDNQVANDRGIMLLYMKLFEYAEIDATPVITCNRADNVFDESFEAHNFLKDFLIYVDETEAYIAPEDPEVRYPYLPNKYADNNGLFLRKLKVGDFISASSDIDFIPALPAENNVDVIRANVSFDMDDLTRLNLTYQKKWMGYNAMIFQPFIDMIDADSKEEISRNLIESVSEDIIIKEWEILNDDPDLFGKEPLVFSYQLEAEDLVQPAGENLIFNVGALIGRQVEMYQEKKRQLPVEGQNNRIYDRVMEIELPDGYTIQNLQDIEIKQTASIDGEEVMLFHSHYTLEGNKLTVYADEFYKQTIIPVEYFEDYRRVINAAADFNNVSLVLKPE